MGFGACLNFVWNVSVDCLGISRCYPGCGMSREYLEGCLRDQKFYLDQKSFGSKIFGTKNLI